MLKSLILLLSAASATLILAACQQKVEQAPADRREGPTRSAFCSSITVPGRRPGGTCCMDVEKAVDDRLLALPNVKAVRTAFNEYNEPSIATTDEGIR